MRWFSHSWYFAYNKIYVPAIIQWCTRSIFEARPRRLASFCGLRLCTYVQKTLARQKQSGHNGLFIPLSFSVIHQKWHAKWLSAQCHALGMLGDDKLRSNSDDVNNCVDGKATAPRHRTQYKNIYQKLLRNRHVTLMKRKTIKPRWIFHVAHQWVRCLKYWKIVKWEREEKTGTVSPHCGTNSWSNCGKQCRHHFPPGWLIFYLRRPANKTWEQVEKVKTTHYSSMCHQSNLFQYNATWNSAKGSLAYRKTRSLWDLRERTQSEETKSRISNRKKQSCALELFAPLAGGTRSFSL